MTPDQQKQLRTMTTAERQALLRAQASRLLREKPAVAAAKVAAARLTPWRAK